MLGISLFLSENYTSSRSGLTFRNGWSKLEEKSGNKRSTNLDRKVSRTRRHLMEREREVRIKWNTDY